MADTLQKALWNPFTALKISELRLKFHWSFFEKGSIGNKSPLVQVISWRQSTNQLLNQRLPILQCIYVTRPQSFKSMWTFGPMSLIAEEIDIKMAIVAFPAGNVEIQHVLICYFFHTKPWIRDGVKSIFTIVIHKWRATFARAITIDEYDVTIPMPRFRVTSQINWGDDTMLSHKRPSLATMVKWATDDCFWRICVFRT